MLSEDELERLADDIYRDRRITGYVYCGTCGYNLRTLPYIYRCPECGQEYNARPLVMKGIYLPLQATALVTDTLTVVFWLAASVVLFYEGSSPRVDWMMILGVGSGALAIFYLCGVWLRFRAFFRAAAIERRIRAEEEEW